MPLFLVTAFVRQRRGDSIVDRAMRVRFPPEAPFFGSWGDISTGRILPSHGRDRGSTPRRSTRTSRGAWVICLLSKPIPRAHFVRPPLRRRGGWPAARESGPRGLAGRLVPGTVAHLGERLTGSQEVVGSTPTGSTIPSGLASSPWSVLLRPSQRGPCLVYRRWRVQFSRAAPWGPAVRTRSAGIVQRSRWQDPTLSMRVRLPLPAPCGGSSTVRARGCQARDGGSTPPHRSVSSSSLHLLFLSSHSGSGTGVRAAL